MLFNSFTYVLLLLPLAVVTTSIARRLWGWRAAQIVILAFSLFFYGYHKPSNLPYLLGSIVVNWQIGRLMATREGQSRKRMLQLGLVLDIGFLCLFKYVNLFARSIPFLVHHRLVLPDLEFPLGVSFFTITQIMYLVNCYEGAVKPNTLFEHATFVSFFPYVISGPISRAKRIIHQFPQLGGLSEEQFPEIARGMYLFSLGLFKKVLFATAFAQAADFGLAPGRTLSMAEAWFFVMCYGMQIYFDFSGYSDMAIGSALMLNIQLTPNFDAPFQATSIIEYWQRWHISLTSFITSYLYTPIIRAFRKRTWLVSSGATVAAMMISGFWHGANWTFVVWGGIHGLALVCNQTWRTRKLPSLSKPVGWLLTMSVVGVAFVFFRASTLSMAVHFLPNLINLHHALGFNTLLQMNGTGFKVPIFAVTQIAGLAVAFIGTSSEAKARNFRPTYLNVASAVALTLCAWLFMNSNIATPFVYFAF